MKRVYLTISIFALILILVFSFFFVEANNTVKITADIIANDSYLMIYVTPNSLSFGQVAKGEASVRQKVCVNNTGTPVIQVTPQISSNYTGKIFNYVEIRKYGTSDPYKKIGTFSLIVQNTSQNGSDQECMWMLLNLTTYNDPIYISKQEEANVTIVAVPQ